MADRDALGVIGGLLAMATALVLLVGSVVVAGQLRGHVHLDAAAYSVGPALDAVVAGAVH